MRYVALTANTGHILFLPQRIAGTFDDMFQVVITADNGFLVGVAGHAQCAVFIGAQAQEAVRGITVFTEYGQAAIITVVRVPAVRIVAAGAIDIALAVILSAAVIGKGWNAFVVV